MSVDEGTSINASYLSSTLYYADLSSPDGVRTEAVFLGFEKVGSKRTGLALLEALLRRLRALNIDVRKLFGFTGDG